MNISVYGPEETDAWMAALERFPQEIVNVYYMPSYLQTWTDHEGAMPRALHISSGDTHFLYPFLQKPLPEAFGGDAYFDIFSAYGYGGMIADRPATRIDPGVMRDVNSAIDDWCRDNGIIAEFIRENPEHAVDSQYLRTAGHVRVRQNVYAQVTDDYGIPSRSARRNIAQARRKGLAVSWDPDMATVDGFAEIYATTAIQGEWDRFYHINTDYFRSVADRLRGMAAIINVHSGSDLAAAAIVLFCGVHTTYHLSGSLPEIRKDRPNDLMLAEILSEADRRGARTVNFGGGMSTQPDDPLFSFKQRFGNRVRDVHVGKRIHNTTVYAHVCDQWEARNPNLVDTYRHYLLKYRIGESC